MRFSNLIRRDSRAESVSAAAAASMAVLKRGHIRGSSCRVVWRIEGIGEGEKEESRTLKDTMLSYLDLNLLLTGTNFN